MSDHAASTAEVSFRVRYAETDAMGIVHHSNYVVYFEEARSEFARQKGMPYSDLEKLGFYLAVTEVTVRYVKPAVYEQRITVQAQLEELKSRGMTFAYTIKDTETDDLLVTGRTKHICITKDGKVARLPEAWRTWADVL